MRRRQYVHAHCNVDFTVAMSGSEDTISSCAARRGCLCWRKHPAHDAQGCKGPRRLFHDRPGWCANCGCRIAPAKDTPSTCRGKDRACYWSAHQTMQGAARHRQVHVGNTCCCNALTEGSSQFSTKPCCRKTRRCVIPAAIAGNPEGRNWDAC